MIVVIDINSNVVTYAPEKKCSSCGKTSNESSDLLQSKGWLRRWDYGSGKFEWLCSDCSNGVYAPQIEERLLVV